MKNIKLISTQTFFGVCCFILGAIPVSAQVPSWEWAKAGGDTLADFAKGVVADGSGNCYVTGYYCGGSITLGSTTLINPGNNNTGHQSDVFLVKYDAAGNVLWAKGAGGFNPDAANDITMDPTGNVIITGYFSDTEIIFDTDTLVNTGGGSDIFVVKYDPSGNVMWARSASGIGVNDQASSISADDSGNCYITGTFDGPTLTFGSNTLTNVTSNSMYSDVFIVKYDPAGNVVWAKSAGGANNDVVHGISASATGECCITGNYKGTTASFGAHTVSNLSPGSYDVFVAKYDAAGNAVWAITGTGSFDDIGMGVATDASGNVYVTGYFSSQVMGFGATTMVTAGSNDLFLASFDPNGTLLWARRDGGSASDGGNDLAIDASGFVYVTGFFASSSITFGASTVVNSGILTEMMVIHYDSAGVPSWAKSADGDGRDEGLAVATDPFSTVYVVGYFQSITQVFDVHTVYNDGVNGKEEDFFVAKLGKESGINVQDQTSDLRVFPNPSSGNFHFSLTGKNDTDPVISIYDGSGKIIFIAPMKNGQVDVDLSGAAAGIYFYRVESEAEIVCTGKLIRE